MAGRGLANGARSVQIRVAADEKMARSKRLIAGARKAHEAVLRAHGREPARWP
jgi:hypothetical protein